MWIDPAVYPGNLDAIYLAIATVDRPTTVQLRMHYPVFDLCMSISLFFHPGMAF